ncbi:rabGTPase-activating protein, partial [Naegleria gruberi]
MLQIKEFEQIIMSRDSTSLLQGLCTKSLSGNLGQSTIRSIIWKIFLGLLPLNKKEGTDHWNAKVNNDRARYEDLIKKHEIDPRKTQAANSSEDDVVDVTFCDPLSQSQSNPWSEFFENSELEKVIVQDLKRLYPEYPFFRTEEIQNYLKRMLFIWSKENDDISYRQGMHELLSPILLVVYRDAQDISKYEYMMTEEEDQKLKLILNLKIDAYDLPIFKISNRIQYLLLEKKDPELYRHLIKMAIEPQIYLLRWVRLLFGREFHIDDAIILWDAIFSDCGGFRAEKVSSSDIDLSLVEHISVAMLHYIRKSLLASDSSYCLKRLMRYPPVEDVHIFIEQALESRSRPNSLLPSMEPLT